MKKNDQFGFWNIVTIVNKQQCDTLIPSVTVVCENFILLFLLYGKIVWILKGLITPKLCFLCLSSTFPSHVGLFAERYNIGTHLCDDHQLQQLKDYTMQNKTFQSNNILIIYFQVEFLLCSHHPSGIRKFSFPWNVAVCTCYAFKADSNSTFVDLCILLRQ